MGHGHWFLIIMKRQIGGLDKTRRNWELAMRQFYELHEQVIEVFKIKHESHPYPWMFKIHTNEGKTICFAGIPNKCETLNEALERASERASWIADGSHDNRYV